ncbi:hypothetical protein EYC84_001393 [Monilinia fructicola]|uniref:Uncharacterized protein n=1 Tax=Monilinia fructicola TaxID=38448 RepID=A0A5M9JS08_MONFR|nr:hypothetical protein EYC84_001393 [Monilinia fructicola]
MQFTTLSLALLAGTAAAYQPGHYHPKRVSNTTTSAIPSSNVATTDLAGQTTLTVYATNSMSLTPITLATTVCPVTEAEAASKNITSQHLTSALASLSYEISKAAGGGSFYGATTTPSSSIPLPTYGASSALGAETTPAVPSKSTPAGYSAPVASLPASSSSAAGLETTPVIPGVSKPSGYSPVSVPLGTASSGAAGAPGSPSSQPGVSAGESTTSQTTTVYGTSTSTHYVTVSAVASGSAAAGTGAADSGSNKSSGSGSGSPDTGSSGSGSSGSGSSGTGSAASGACEPVTVTVTAAAQTVTLPAETVTVTAGVPTYAASVPTYAPSDIQTAVVSTSDAAGVATNPVVVSTATVVPVPVTTPAVSSVPFYGNGTVVTSTRKSKSKCASSGFLTSKARPTGAKPTGY